MSNPGYPYQNVLWYYRQANYDTCPDVNDTALPVSAEWHVARIGTADKHVEDYSADSVVPTVLWEQVNDYTFHLEYVPQCGDTLITDCINRQSDCTLRSLAFILGVNTCTVTDDQSWFEICGAKAKTISLSASNNNKWVVSIDFSVKSIITDGNASFITDDLHNLSHKKPTALTGEYCGFNVAGSITNNGVAFADIIDSCNITVENNLKDRWDHDSLEKQFCLEGKVSVKGSFSMSMDEGGASHWGDVIDQDEFTVRIYLGGSGCPAFTLNNCRWTRSEISLDVEDDAIMEDAPFTSRPTDATSIAGKVP